MSTGDQSHVFLHCCFTHSIWSKLLGDFGITWHALVKCSEALLQLMHGVKFKCEVLDLMGQYIEGFFFFSGEFVLKETEEIF